METIPKDNFAALYARAVRLLAVRMRAEQELRIHTAIEEVRCTIPGAVAPRGF